MPVVELDIDRLCSLIGHRLEAEQLVETISQLGADVEGTDGKTITVEFFPNRPDLLSVEGVALALRAFMGIESGLNHYSLSSPKVNMRVDSSVKPIREFVVCVDVKDVELDGDIVQGLMQMQEELHWALGRDRKKVAVGVHDSSKINPPYTYKAAIPEEISFVPLGMSDEMNLREILERHPKGVEYAHIIDCFDRYPIIMDSKGEVLSMPPIINGELTKLTEETTQIFVEITGTEERAVNKALNIITTAIAEYAWTLFKVNVMYPETSITTPDLTPEKRSFPLGYLNKMLGLELSHKEVKKCLERMGYGVEMGDDLTLHIPTYRADILHDIDIVEDVAIGFGYQNFDATLPSLSNIGHRLPEEETCRRGRMSMLGLGFTEIVTLMLTNEEANNEKMGIKEEPIKVKNPLSEEHSVIRTHLLPSLFEALYLNRHRELPQRIFEVGDVLRIDSNLETGSGKEKRLCACIVHPKANFSEAKAVFGALFRDLGIEGNASPLEHPSFIPGRCAGVDGVGYYGEVHPQVLSNFKLEYPAVALEMIIR